jgi:hypothetical protein
VKRGKRKVKEEKRAGCRLNIRSGFPAGAGTMAREAVTFLFVLFPFRCF